VRSHECGDWITVNEVLEREATVGNSWLHDETQISGKGLHDEVNVVDSHREIGGLPINSTTWRELGSITDLQKCGLRGPKGTVQLYGK